MSDAETAGEGRASVTISRTGDDDVRERQVVARLDDDPKVTLYFGDSVTRSVSAGDHRLRAHNTLVWKTVRFTLEPGDDVEFLLVNYAPRFAFSMLALMGAGPLFLRVERRDRRRAD